MRVARIAVIVLGGCIALGSGAQAEEWRVTNAEELTAALEAAGEGDAIVLEPGTYKGALYRENLRKVTISSADPANPGVIEGGSYGLHLTDPMEVTLANLVFQGQAENGINIDDAGSYETPARDITLINITVKDIGEGGNHDAIKMAGVDGFLIDGARIENWGDEGSAIDFVGGRNGLVQNSLLIHSALTVARLRRQAQGRQQEYRHPRQPHRAAGRDRPRDPGRRFDRRGVLPLRRR